jgi:hypothetical protein
MKTELEIAKDWLLVAADLLEEVIGQHIYDYDEAGDEKLGPDFQYAHAVKEIRTFLANPSKEAERPRTRMGIDVGNPDGEYTAYVMHSTGFLDAPAFLSAMRDLSLRHEGEKALKMLVTAYPELPGGVAAMILDGSIETRQQGRAMFINVPVKPTERKACEAPEPSAALFLVNLNTYHGAYAGGDTGESAEYGFPVVPVKIEVAQDAIYIDMLPADDVHPSITMERQTDRWMILVAGESGCDEDLVIQIMDKDSQVVVYSNHPRGYNQGHLLFTDNKLPSLPPEECRFGAPPKKE